MTKAEYKRFEAAFRTFFKREGVVNLTTGYLRCPQCGGEWDDSGKCEKCGADQQCWDEPMFSKSPCDCCGTRLHGDREHATGFTPTTREVQEYEICSDCAYYAEYGRLDDTTMLEVERSAA
jgi:hypothetical protein